MFEFSRHNRVCCLYLGNAIDRHDTPLYQKKITRTRNAQMHTQMLCKTLTPTLEHRYVLDNREDIIKALVVILTIAAASDRVESESVSDDRYRAHVFFLVLAIPWYVTEYPFDFYSTYSKTTQTIYRYSICYLLLCIPFQGQRSSKWIVLCISINAAL